eukprot:6479878-Karenia_brevis.AAC.1
MEANPHPKAVRSRSKKCMIFCIALHLASGSILGQILEGFGTQVAGHVGQNSSPIASCLQVG